MSCVTPSKEGLYIANKMTWRDTETGDRLTDDALRLKLE